MNTTFAQRRLGKGGPLIGPMGVGTWAIGGPFFSGEGCDYPTGAPLGYGEVDDGESIRALHCALDLGAKLFDTSDAYGTGHGERVVGQALKRKRGDVFIATKFGNTFDEESKQLTGTDCSSAYIRNACEASLKRLQTDWIDLYQLHVGDLPNREAEEVADTLERLSDEGMIRFYGWSTNDPEKAATWGRRRRAAAVQFNMNVFEDAPGMLGICDTHNFAGLVRLPLAMGFLSGKFTADSRLAEDDIRSQPPTWLRYFKRGGGAAVDWSRRLDDIRQILTSEGRSLAQGALSWIWGRSGRTIPIPGIRTAAQAEENLGALQFGPLGESQIREIELILRRP